MRKYLPAIFVSLFFLLIIGGAVGYGVYSSNKKNAADDKLSSMGHVGTSGSAEAITQNGLSTQTGGNAQGSSLGVTSDGGIGLGLQSNLGGTNGASNGSNSSSAGTGIPGPETFGQYEQYKSNEMALFADLKQGTGAEVSAGSKAQVLYKGYFTNGQIFDQSQTDESGKLVPFVFTVGEHKVITGWEQAIIGMKVGGTRRFVVPPTVGYGETGQGPIPGNAVLIFDVQLLNAL